jgi:hypothetical protein
MAAAASSPAILDSRGNAMDATAPVSPFGGGNSYSRQIFPNGSQLYPVTQDTDYRSFRPYLDTDVAALLPRFRFRAMLSDARYIYAQGGLLAGGIHSKADYTIGGAWRSRYLGTDTAWGAQAEKVLSAWHRVFCLRGPAFHWHKTLWLGCKSLDVDGDFFIHRTKTAEGYPQIQFLEAHRIGSRNAESFVAQGEYEGLLMNNGVILGDDGRPVAYRVLGSEPGEDKDVSAAAITHVFDPRWYSQTRGIPALCYPILDWYDITEIRDAEKIGVKAASSIGLIEKNPAGGIDSGSAFIKSGQTGAVPAGLKTEMYAKGLIRYFASNSGSGLESFTSSRPSPAWQGFMQHLISSGFIGIDWSVEMVNPSDLKPAAARVIAGKCARSVASRQSVLRHGALSCDLFALSCFIERGDLPAPPADWTEWGYTMPPKVSGEVNRDAEQDRLDYIVGRRNMGELVEADGRSFTEHLEERAAQAQARNDLLKKYPDLTEADFGIITPNGNPTKQDISATQDELAAETGDKKPAKTAAAK